MNVKKLSLTSLLLMMVCGFGWANTFVKVTKKSQLVPGNNYIILCQDRYDKPTETNGYAAISVDDGSDKMVVVQKSGTGSTTMYLIVTDINQEEKPVAFTLGKSGDNYTFLDTSNGKYFGMEHNGRLTWTSTASPWTISETSMTFQNGEGGLFLVGQGHNYLSLQGEGNERKPQFKGAYNESPVALYVESQGGSDVGETMITFARSTSDGATDKNYYATVYYEKDFKLDAHITAYGIDAFDKPLTGTVEVGLNKVQDPTEIVWAKSPVLLKVNSADVEGNPEFIEYPIYMMETATTDNTFATNLKGSGAEGFTVPEGSYIYKLSMVEGEVGFWRTRTSVLPNKAYMEIPAPEEGEGVKSFTFNFNNETAIKEVTTPQKQDVNNDDTYNLLTGQKVNKNYKGLVVKKGKKFFNK